MLLKLVIAAAIVSIVGTARSECAPTYPASLPCVEGGKPTPLPAMVERAHPSFEKFLMAYPREAPDLYEDILGRATNAGWAIESREVATEPSGLRYRATMQKSTTRISIAVVPAQGGAMLLVVKASAATPSTR